MTVDSGARSVRKRVVSLCAVVAVGCAAGASPAAAAATSPSGPPLPTAANGHAVQVFASGLTIPTSFAFSAGQVFAGDGGNPPESPGGVFLLKDGKATKLPDSPPYVAGVAWHKGTLYISAARFGADGSIVSQILAWSGWNGRTFTQHRVFYTATPGFPGFNGLAIGPDHRLYVGVALAGNNDHGPVTAPYQYDVLTFGLNGDGPSVFASGIRQPWQIAFAHGDRHPFVTDLGQDLDAKDPPDFLLHITRGESYGFPQCNWTVPAACQASAKPFRLFAPHSDVGGIAIARDSIYLSEFGFAGPPQVVAVPVKGGGTARTVLSGFVAPVIGLGAHGEWLYVGSLDGNVYRVHL